MRRFLTFLIIAAATLVSGPRSTAQVLVIAHGELTANSVSKAELGKIFTGASTRLPGGVRVIPVMLKEGEIHVQFSNAYLDKSPVALILIWRGLVLSGQASMPKTFEGEDAMVAYVARTPGAIGYIGSKTPHDNVKVLHVN